MTDDESILITYERGPANVRLLQATLSDLWSDPSLKVHFEQVLTRELHTDEYHIDLTLLPYEIRSNSNLTGAEIEIAIATGFLTAMSKDIGASAWPKVKDVLRRFWRDHLEQVINRPSQKLGPRKRNHRSTKRN